MFALFSMWCGLVELTCGSEERGKLSNFGEQDSMTQEEEVSRNKHCYIRMFLSEQE